MQTTGEKLFPTTLYIQVLKIVLIVNSGQFMKEFFGLFGFTLSVSFYRCSIVTHMSSRGWTGGPLAATVTQRHRLPLQQ
jgi:hypothetical protein